MQHCSDTVRFIIYNTDVSERKSRKRSFEKNLASADFNSALMAQQVIMLLFIYYYARWQPDIQLYKHDTAIQKLKKKHKTTQK